MATPIIRSINANPDTLQPGQSTQVVIDAFDPDARTVTLSGSVTDAAGNTASAITTLTVGDPLTYTLTSSDAGVTIAADPNSPGRYTVTV